MSVPTQTKAVSSIPAKGSFCCGDFFCSKSLIEYFVPFYNEANLFEFFVQAPKNKQDSNQASFSAMPVESSRYFVIR